MSASATPIGSPVVDGMKEEDIEKAVSDVFDELFTEVSAKVRKLHPSEQVDRNNQMYSMSRIYDFINPYHAFCRLCEQHFYTRSDAEDINSFFQKHINTSYHRQLRMFHPWPDEEAILTWEQRFHSGRCNVCELSGIDSFVISTKFCVERLMRQHVCVWSGDQRETNEKFLRKLSLLRKYCSLKMFRDKFLKSVQGKMVCLLCGTVLSWSEDKVGCHLHSDTHYQKFCMFIWANFNFAPKDLLNGFNLETITRWLIVFEPPQWNKLVTLNELAACVSDSNNFRNPYPEDKKNVSYSPAYMGMLLRDEEIDLLQRNRCLLCNVEMEPGHLTTSMHRRKAVGLGECSFIPSNYHIYQQNRKRRLLPYLNVIETYEKLRDEKIKEEVFLPVSAHYVKFLLAKKVPLVDRVIAVFDDAEVFCHVCDVYLEKSNEDAHLESQKHKAQVEKWSRLKKTFESERFTEPFKRVRSGIACLLCGEMVHTNSFFAHVKSETHAEKLEWYGSLDSNVPISSAFRFSRDLYCRCTVCDSLVSDSSSLKEVLESIKAHWPCPEVLERKGKVMNGEGKAVNEQNQESNACPGDKNQKGKSERNNKKGAKTEVKTNDQSVKNANDKSPHLKNRLESPRSEDGKVKARRIAEVNRAPAVVKESVPDSVEDSECKCCKSSTCTCPVPATPNANVEEAVKGKKNKTTEENAKKGQKGKENESVDEEEEKDEVLLLKGLPKKKRKCNLIHTVFQAFGQIRYVMFHSKTAVVAFVERGVAMTAALEAKTILQEPKLAIMVSERKMSEKKEKEATAPLLSKAIVDLLQNTPCLMEFVLSLNYRAVTASQSPVETKREELVCNMIVHAVLERFPRCRCYPFGSRLTGLSLNSSDLDVFLDCGGMYEGFKNTTPHEEKKLVRTVANALRKVGNVRDLIVVDNARVPIVSFHHLPTGLNCDISFKNGLGIQNSLLIKFLVSLDWRVKGMILFMKYWAEQLDLHGPPYFSSYALSMLVINYLEQLESPVLPTIECLQKSFVGRRVTIGGWDCSINMSKSAFPPLNNVDTFQTLLLGFFEFYADFDFCKNVVFPLTGKALPRDAFSDVGKGKLPMCFKRHILNLPAPIENLVSDKFPICIIDPFDLSHILTKSFSFQDLMGFVYLCQRSKQYLKKGIANSLSDQ